MRATDKAFKSARLLRRALSLPEKLLWVRLRGADVRFRRQHPIGSYILDFYCPAAKLAIEVDGMAHDMGDRPKRDVFRAEWLNSKGIAVLRIPAAELLANPDDVADAIMRLCLASRKPLHHPAAPDGPPPHACGAGRSE